MAVTVNERMTGHCISVPTTVYLNILQGEAIIQVALSLFVVVVHFLELQ
jgi:hypothetical protein